MGGMTYKARRALARLGLSMQEFATERESCKVRFPAAGFLVEGGGVWVGFRCRDQAASDGILVDVFAAGEEVGAAEDEVVGEAALSDGEPGGQAVGEAAFDALDRPLQDDGLRGEQEVDVVGHEDEGVELVVPFPAIVPEGSEE
jgi:hypothetical protein